MLNSLDPQNLQLRGGKIKIVPKTFCHVWNFSIHSIAMYQYFTHHFYLLLSRKRSTFKHLDHLYNDFNTGYVAANSLYDSQTD